MYDVKTIQREEKKVVALVLRTTFEGNRQAEQIPPFFHKIMDNDALEHVPNRINKNQLCAIVMKPGSPEFDYYMGVEVSGFDKVPDGMETLVIPGCHFANTAFIKRGNPDVLGAFKYLTETWMPNQGYGVKPGVPMFIYYDERFIPSFKDHGYDGTQIAEINIPVK